MLKSVSSVEEWSIDNLHEHDHVIDHIEDEHARLGRAETDIPVARPVGADRRRLGIEALAEIVAATALPKHPQSVDLVRQIGLIRLTKCGRELSREARPSVTHQW